MALKGSTNQASISNADYSTRAVRRGVLDFAADYCTITSAWYYVSEPTQLCARLGSQFNHAK